MGMFDSVFVKCNECGEQVEFQSKSGDCSMNCYGDSNWEKIPKAIIGDLEGDVQSCYECGSAIVFPFRIIVVRM